MRIEDPLLPDCVANAQHRTPEYLAAKCAGMDDRPDIGGGEEIHDVILAGFHIDFDLGKASHVGKRSAVARVIVLGRRHQTLASQRRYRCFCQFVNVIGNFVTVVNSA